MLEISAGKKFWALVGLLLISFAQDQMDAQTSSTATGIEGIVSVSPIHGGPSRVGVADSAPLANTVFEVTNAAGVATTFTTDNAGRFRVPLPPGRYTIKKSDAKKFPRCGPFEVEVTAAGFNKVTWECDSGMR
jgi:prealbumin domain-containing protein